MEALYCGVPLVTLPQMPELAANADRVVEQGLAERLASDTLTQTPCGKPFPGHHG
jgi:UDP:flavonoid glycosyltransferase YjiC (YdhE family)